MFADDETLVRVGPVGDGGYLVPKNALKNITTLFSPGVADESGFEMDCANRGMDVYLADGSVDAPSVDHPLFHFTRRHLTGDGESTADGMFMTLEDWMNASLPKGDKSSDLMLQMDIEGHEYDVLMAAPDELLTRFKIIVVRGSFAFDPLPHV